MFKAFFFLSISPILEYLTHFGCRCRHASFRGIYLLLVHVLWIPSRLENALRTPFKAFFGAIHLRPRTWRSRRNNSRDGAGICRNGHKTFPWKVVVNFWDKYARDSWCSAFISPCLSVCKCVSFSSCGEVIERNVFSVCRTNFIFPRFSCTIWGRVRWQRKTKGILIFPVRICIAIWFPRHRAAAQRCNFHSGWLSGSPGRMNK